MKVGAAIYSLLVNDSAVSALVGTRIYPELAEEGASAPYVVYSVVSNTPSDTKDGTPIDEAQLEIFSVGSTYAAANKNHTVMDFIFNNWAELLIGLMAFVKVVINLTPTEKDNQIFGYLDSLINMIIADRIKPNNKK